jgi:hypothetical protein
MHTASADAGCEKGCCTCTCLTLQCAIGTILTVRERIVPATAAIPVLLCHVMGMHASRVGKRASELPQLRHVAECISGQAMSAPVDCPLDKKSLLAEYCLVHMDHILHLVRAILLEWRAFQKVSTRKERKRFWHFHCHRLSLFLSIVQLSYSL